MKRLTIILAAIWMLIAVMCYAARDEIKVSPTWPLGFLLTALFFAGLAVALHFRPDRAPDLLHRKVGKYFDRRGFCFGFQPHVEQGVFHLLVFFQNRYARPCLGGVVLRQRDGLFEAMPNRQLEFRVECPGGAFGVGRVPIAIPRALQGRTLPVAIGAMGRFAQGRGRKLRFRGAYEVRTPASFQRSGDAEFAKAVANLALGGSVTSFASYQARRAGTEMIAIPMDVAESLNGDEMAQTEILWSPADAQESELLGHRVDDSI